MEISYLPSNELDKTKWNSCVHYANNGQIFGYMWYLDQVAKTWDALIEGDYESVWPLPWRKDWLGRPQLTQPPLISSLSIYSIHVLSPLRIQRFLEAVPEVYKHWELTLDFQADDESGLKAQPLTNYLLFLQTPYESLADGFSRALLLELEQAEQAELRVQSGIKPEVVADFYELHARHDADRSTNKHALLRIMYNALHRGWGFSSGTYHPDGELLACNFYLYSHGRVMSLAPLQNERGQKLGALATQTNLLLRSHAGRPMALDFNTTTESPFAQSFGALAQHRYQLRKGNTGFWKLW